MPSLLFGTALLLPLPFLLFILSGIKSPFHFHENMLGKSYWWGFSLQGIG
jgi:hypothetical protein